MNIFYEVIILTASIFIIVLVVSILKIYLVNNLPKIDQDSKPIYQKGEKVYWSTKHKRKSVIHNIYVSPLNGKTIYLLRNGVRLTRKELLEANYQSEKM